MRHAQRATQTCSNDLPRLSAILEGNEDALLRLVIGLIAREMGRQRGKAVPAEELASWSDQTNVDEDSLGVDSLARLEIVAAVNQAFQLHRTGVEDYLLVHRSLGDWCRLITEGFRLLPQDEPEQIAFQTSGSTGTPTTVVHDVVDLLDEVSAHPDLFPGTRRVLAAVPAQHIYGFLFTVLSPLLHGWTVLDLAHRAPGALAREAREGDLLVGTPFTWALALRSGASFTGQPIAVTSTAPAPAGLWSDLDAIGLPRLFEVYGSTETSGIGTRQGGDQPFELMAHLDPVAADPAATDVPTIAATRLTGTQIQPPDHVDRLGPRSFAVAGRRDDAVQVGGINVFPGRVRDILTAAPGVADAAVRLEQFNGTARLKAFIVPKDPDVDGTDETLEPELRRYATEHLSNPERPAAYTFGPALPRNAMGKLVDW